MNRILPRAKSCLPLAVALSLFHSVAFAAPQPPEPPPLERPKPRPAQDQAYSITVKELIEQNQRHEAADKLREWELRHPMAKFDSDFLLLRGRVLNAFGRWTESLAEPDSFKKMQNENPYLIDADFCRAEVLCALGRQQEARKIWNGIATSYPRHELAARSRELAAKQ